MAQAVLIIFARNLLFQSKDETESISNPSYFRFLTFDFFVRAQPIDFLFHLIIAHALENLITSLLSTL